MEWIATAALVAIAVSAGIATAAFLDFSAAVLEYMNTPRTNLNTHIIPQELIDLLTNFRRYKPREKKETVA